MSVYLRPLASVLALVCLPSLATAQVMQPNGMTVPVDSANGEQQLSTFFAGRGEGIDWIGDARQTPETFSPLCDFTAAFVLNEAGNQFGVGWYNAEPGASAAPTAGEIYEIVPAGSPIGTTITGATIRDDGRYAGGLIGFALLRSPPHFTEARWNTVCNAGPCAGTPGPWVLSLTYASTVEPNAFYIAFEDGDTSASSWNNDGDYNDDVFYFTGIACAGSGEACAVEGAMGVCAGGLTECETGGALSCRMVTSPGDEACDGADNDCDGSTDEGEGLCGATEVCDRGVCVGRCFEGGCASEQSCADGLCVETSCVGVSCPAGERCRGGVCGDACDGVTCPGDTVCQTGACVDPCAGVTCGEMRVCEGGVCVDSCECRACATGLECAASGRCVDEGCGAVSCASGEVCQAGACVDACTGAVCPAGQACAAGVCADVEAPDAGPRDPDAGGGARDAGNGGGLDAGAAGLDGGGGVDAGEGGVTDGGCGCRAAIGSRAPLVWPLLALLLWRRRSRGRSTAR